MRLGGGEEECGGDWRKEGGGEEECGGDWRKEGGECEEFTSGIIKQLSRLIPEPA